MKFILLNGHPGSGKTTVAQELRTRVPRLAILDVDSFRKFVSDYGHSKKDVALMWEVAYAIIETYFENGLSVLVDRCVEEETNRMMLKKLAKKYGAEFQEVILYTKTLRCAVDRVKNRPAKHLSKNRKSLISKTLIASLRKRLVEDRKKKGIISFDTEKVSAQDVAKEIHNIFKKK